MDRIALLTPLSCSVPSLTYLFHSLARLSACALATENGSEVSFGFVIFPRVKAIVRPLERPLGARSADIASTCRGNLL
jgi:hypothetical protein